MNLDYSKHQHFSFDLWLTLIKSQPEFKEKRNLLFRDFFEIEHGIEKVAEHIRYYDLLTNRINEQSGLNMDTNEIYFLILNALNVDIEKIDLPKLNQFYEESASLFSKYKPRLIYKNTHDLLQKIKSENKTMNLLSNTAFIKGKTLRKMLDDYDLSSYFSFQIYSDEVGYSKPNTKIFDIVYKHALQIKNLEKKDILHIGDNIIADYKGAIAFGFDAFLLKY